MKKYKCIRKCYFLNRVFEKGERFDAPPSLEVPKHFVEVPDAILLTVDENPELATFHQMNQANSGPIQKSASDVKFEGRELVEAEPEKVPSVSEYSQKKKK